MPSKKKSDLKSAATAKPPRKLTRHSGQFKPGNPHRFEAGVSGNPTGRRANEFDRVLSRAVCADLADRAPNDICEQVGMPHHSSWAQCLGRTLLKRAFNDISFARLVLEYSEGLPKASVALDATITGDGTSAPERLVVEFVSSEFTKAHPDETTVVTTSKNALPPPLIEARELAIKDAEAAPDPPMIDEPEIEAPEPEPEAAEVAASEPPAAPPLEPPRLSKAVIEYRRFHRLPLPPGY